MKAAEDIVDGLSRLRGEHQARLSSYAELKGAYFGTGSPGRNTTMDTTGRPILRMGDIRAELRARRGAPNKLQPIVDNFVAYKGPMPLLPVLPSEETAEGEDRALLRSRALRQQLEHSDMDVQMIDGAFYLSCEGDCVLVADPVMPKDSDEWDEPGIYVTVYDPELAFPVFHTGRKRQELKELYLVWEMGAAEAKEIYRNVEVQNDEDRVQVVTYYSESERVIVIDEQEVARYRHDLKFVPAQWVRNKQVGGRFAQADIAQAVDVHEEMQALSIVMGDATIEAVYAPVWVRDALNVPGDQLVIGPREIISLGEKGAVGRLDPAPPPQAAANLLQDLQQGLFQTTGVAPVQIENQHSGSNLSGRYMHAEQQPMETRLRLNQTIVGFHLERLGQKVLLMMGKLEELATHTFHIAGSDKGKFYSYDVTGAELGGPSRVQAKWDSLMGSTRHERLVMALQVFAQGLVPASYVVEQLGVDDPEALLKKAQTERAALQPTGTGGPPAATGGPPQPGGDPGQQQQQIGQPGQDAAGAAQGSPEMGGGAPPQGAPPGAGQPPPPQVPQMPGFGGMPVSPAQPGMGPAPQTPDPVGQARKAIASLPSDAQDAIVGEPVMVGSQLTLYVKEGRYVANGLVKRAFADQGLDVRIKVAS